MAQYLLQQSKRGRKTLKKNKDFEHEMMDIGRIPNIAAGLVTILYVIFFAGLNIEQLGRTSVFAIIIVGFLQFCIAPLTNKAITKKLTIDLEAFKADELNIEERTKLIKQLLSCPKKIALQVFIVFILGIGIWTSSFYFIFKISALRTWLSIGSAILGAYVAALLALNYSEKLCSHHAIIIIHSGINEKEIQRYHFFGISNKTLYIMSTIIPICLTNTITFLLFYRIKYETYIAQSLILSMLLVAISNTSLIIILSKIIFTRLLTIMKQINVALNNIKSQKIEIMKPLDTDLANEISYIIFLINQVFYRFVSILKETRKMGTNVQKASANLSISTQQTSSTALEQSTAIKEVVASMEDSDSLEKNIITHVGDVTLISSKTSTNVDEGFRILEQNIVKMQEIQHSNDIIIDGITGLKNSLKGIQEISELISNIADLTKIIAFNAELEAAALDNNNTNFNHVADEIRLLAENIVKSTHSIKATLNDIYKTADTLVIKSQEGTKKIHEGVEVTTNLHSYFINLKESAEKTKLSSQNIQNVVNHQKISQQQILVTLKQLSNGLEDITKSTQNINSQAVKLDNLSHLLETVNLGETE
jgi:methyl-accepting chemotaxis protein